jgi:hypothetical protein
VQELAAEVERLGRENDELARTYSRGERIHA